VVVLITPQVRTVKTTALITISAILERL